MTKNDLIKKIAKYAEISEESAEKACQYFLNQLQELLKENENSKDTKIKLVGFGTFIKERRVARGGRNPVTGKPIKIKARTAIKSKHRNLLK